MTCIEAYFSILVVWDLCNGKGSSSVSFWFILTLWGYKNENYYSWQGLNCVVESRLEMYKDREEQSIPNKSWWSRRKSLSVQIN